ncbi:MAG: hypothetical protein ACREDG_03965 [Methylocella sp.]
MAIAPIPPIDPERSLDPAIKKPEEHAAVDLSAPKQPNLFLPLTRISRKGVARSGWAAKKVLIYTLARPDSAVLTAIRDEQWRFCGILAWSPL